MDMSYLKRIGVSVVLAQHFLYLSAQTLTKYTTVIVEANSWNVENIISQKDKGPM